MGSLCLHRVCAAVANKHASISAQQAQVALAGQFCSFREPLPVSPADVTVFMDALSDYAALGVQARHMVPKVGWQRAAVNLPLSALLKAQPMAMQDAAGIGAAQRIEASLMEWITQLEGWTGLHHKRHMFWDAAQQQIVETQRKNLAKGGETIAAMFAAVAAGQADAAQQQIVEARIDAVVKSRKQYSDALEAIAQQKATPQQLQRIANHERGSAQGAAKVSKWLPGSDYWLLIWRAANPDAKWSEAVQAWQSLWGSGQWGTAEQLQHRHSTLIEKFAWHDPVVKADGSIIWQRKPVVM